VSFRVLVIPEDPTYNGYILQPTVERMLAELEDRLRDFLGQSA